MKMELTALGVILSSRSHNSNKNHHSNFLPGNLRGKKKKKNGGKRTVDICKPSYFNTGFSSIIQYHQYQ